MDTETRTYRLCRAGQDLLAAFDSAYPKRDHGSDGWVGDTSHAARASDHNPNRRFRPAIVKALDIDKDLRTGRPGDFNAAVERVRVVASRGDRRFIGGYIIWNRSICSAKTGWRWARYRGANGHTAHAHFSFADAQANFDLRGGWPVRQHVEPVMRPTVIPHAHPMPTLSPGMTATQVRDAQGHLNAWRKARRLSLLLPDGKYTDATEYAVEVFQQAYGLERDGVIGPVTYPLLHRTTGGKRLESNGRTF